MYTLRKWNEKKGRYEFCGKFETWDEADRELRRRAWWLNNDSKYSIKYSRT